MKVREVTVKSESGLDSRPAAVFVNKASSFKSFIWIEKGERKANAKSLLGVLSLGLAKDTAVTIIADGEDEAEAIEQLSKLFENG